MILPDVNTLVYAFRPDTTEHPIFTDWLRTAAGGPEPLLLADVVLTGFLRIVTNRRIFEEPAPSQVALEFVSALQRAPATRSVAATDSAWRQLARFVAEDPYIVGNLIPDAWIASLAFTNGARVATADAGFARFRGLVWFNPARTA